MNFILIDDEMRRVAKQESVKREPDIKHHFTPSHLTREEQNELGFLGEFACCKLFGMDWKANIRKDYRTIDHFDILYKQWRIDVKTESVPDKFAQNIINKTIKDDALYGRRLINGHQFPLLNKYDLVIFGMTIRERYDKWYPVGFLATSEIIKNYSPQKTRPDGGGTYHSAAVAIRTSELKAIEYFREHYQ